MSEAQFEKVCKGLEHEMQNRGQCGHYCGEGVETVSCRYDKSGLCIQHWGKDALALIRQQQERIKELETAQTARVITLEDAAKSDVCWMEDKDMDQVMPCRIRWNYNSYFIKLFVGSPERFAENDYGTIFRCWTQRPTDEQREAAKWDG